MPSDEGASEASPGVWGIPPVAREPGELAHTVDTNWTRIYVGSLKGSTILVAIGYILLCGLYDGRLISVSGKCTTSDQLTIVQSFSCWSLNTTPWLLSPGGAHKGYGNHIASTNVNSNVSYS